MATPKKTAPTGRAADVCTTAIQRAPIAYSDEPSDVVERRIDLTTIHCNQLANKEMLDQVRNMANDILQSLDSQRVPYYGSDTCEQDKSGIIYYLDEVTRETCHALGDVKIILELIRNRISG